MSAPTTTLDTDPGRLDARTRAILAVLVTGGLMVVLDTTITNVAIGRLSSAMDAPLSVIQWVLTGYTLALATVLPTTAWAIGRWGTKAVYMSALAGFVSASLLAGLAWNIESLIAFRVLQGFAGGLVMPVGMTIALRASAPHQRGRVLALLGFPVLVGPTAGPPLGGWLLDDVSWRAIFLINVPIGLLALVLAARLLVREERPPPRPLDRRGLLLLSPGLALLVYGLANAGERGTLLTFATIAPLVVGLGLVVGFVARGMTLEDPLVNVRLLRLRAMAVGAGTLGPFAAAYFGSMFLGPLYYQVVRGESATMSGLLGIPQAITTGLMIQVAGRLVDRMPVRRVVPVAIGTAMAGFGAFALLLSADRPYWQLASALAVAGLGVGATMMPTMTDATRHLDDADLPSGSTLLNLTSQVGVSMGAAVVSVALATAIAARLPQLAGGIGGVYGVADHTRIAMAPRLADAFQVAYLLPLGLMAVSLLVVLLGHRATGRR